MKALEAIGRVVGYAVVALVVLAISAADIWILLRYGLVVWLFVVPVVVTLFGLVLSLGAMAVYGIGWGVHWLGSAAVRLVTDRHNPGQT
jgi:nucleoside permease NupC